jgi:hypothetical protein
VHAKPGGSWTEHSDIGSIDDGEASFCNEEQDRIREQKDSAWSRGGSLVEGIFSVLDVSVRVGMMVVREEERLPRRVRL